MKRKKNKIFYFLSHLFLPQESNGFRAKFLHLDFLTIVALFVIFGSFVFAKKSNGKVLGYATDITVKKLFALTNFQREKFGLKPLNYSDKLAKAAFLKANDMFKRNYWSHYAPDGTAPWQFILNAGYDYEYAGENLAKNFLYSDAVVGAWMHSKAHRENILNPNYTDVGFAVKNGVLQGEQTTLVVQMFGRPLKKEPSFAGETNNVKNSFSRRQQRFTPDFGNYELLFKLNTFLLSFLIILLILDIVYATELSVIRLSGKNLAHLIFLIFIFFTLTIITKGRII